MSDDANSTNGDANTTFSTANGSGDGAGAPDQDAIKMFVGQVPRSWTETELRNLFDEYGPVYQLSVLRDKLTGESRGCCFVTFYHRKDAIMSQGALHNIKVLPGMHHPIQMKPADSENRNERKLFVGMVSKKANEIDIKSLFASFGLIEDCSVLRDTAGNSKGCAFVTFSSRASALNAIKAMHHSRTMEGCSMPLVVKFADTQKDKDQKKTGGATSGQPAIGATVPGATGGLMGLGANMAAAAPVLRHSSLLSGAPAVLPSYLGLLQQLPGFNAATMPSAGMAQSSGFQLLPGQNPNAAGLNPAASMGGYYGLNSQMAANNMAPSVNGVAALINYLLAAAAVSSAPGTNNMATGLSALQAASVMNPALAQSWKQSALTSPPSLSPSASALNGNLIQLTGASPYLSQAYGPGGGGISYPGSTTGTTSPLGAGNAAGSNSVKQMEGPEGANLFIYHLPQEFTDTDLAQTFSPFGSMLSAKVFVDKQTNLSKCFGFVSYENPASALAAIQAMNGFQIGAKRLKVQLKRSKQDSKPYQHPQQTADNVKTERA